MDKLVLLVEDDLDLRDILRDILENEGYDVVPAADRRQALDYVRGTSSGEDAPAVLILDLMMPLVSGWEVLNAILADPQLRVPVIVVSASGRSRPRGVTAYLRKPFSLADLLDTVHDRCQLPERRLAASGEEPN